MALATIPGTVGEWTARNFRAVLVIEGYGIDFHAEADTLLEDACRARSLDPARVAAEIDAVTQPRTIPDLDFNRMPLRDLVRHIVERHHEYLKLEMPRLRARLNKMVDRHGERDERLLARLHPVYCDLQSEFELHMHKEEMALFPVIEAYARAVETGSPAPPPPFGTVRNPIRMMEHEHDSALKAFKLMREITRDYVPADYACANFRAVFHSLEEMEADVIQHIHLENDILHPRATALEEQLFG